MKKSNFSFSLGVGIMAVLIIFVWVGQGNAQGSCDEDDDCPYGRICENNICTLPECTVSNDCPWGDFCFNGRCITNPESCTVNEDCPYGEICEYNNCHFLCTTHYDCPHGEFCYKGRCIRDSKANVYHCGKYGCKPGYWCMNQEGKKKTCEEDESYVCENACDCGPAHACIFISQVQGKRCVYDIHDPWVIEGTAIFDAEIPDGEPTYCCAASECLAGRLSYGSNVSEFVCYDEYTQSSSNYCGGKSCFYSGDCEWGEVCVDVYTPFKWDFPREGTFCSWNGGRCIGGATAEAVFGWRSSALLKPCAECPPDLEGLACEVGWKPGGTYIIQRVIGECGSCPNGSCEEWEDYLSCPQDCPAYLHVCGDGFCTSLETPKNCPEDCKIVCGDGSCDSSEVTACPEDCGCPGSFILVDHLSLCGDGYCDPNPYSLENCLTCPFDCCPVALCQDVTVNADSTCTASAPIDNGSYFPGGDSITLTQSPEGPYPKGNTSVTLTVTHIQGGTSQCTGTVTVVDNTPPSIIAPTAVTAYTGPGSTSCGAVVDDTTLGTATYWDNCSVITGTRSGVPPENIFPVGTTTITYTATDESGNTVTVPQLVAVIDNTPPQITNISANPSVLWPPNHKMALITPSVVANDNCNGGLTTQLQMITTNEGEETNTYDPNYDSTVGDGHTLDDIQVDGSGNIFLRAERSGTGTGRIYTITYEMKDASGNSSSASAIVAVPHSQ